LRFCSIPKLENFLNHKAKIILILKWLDISKQRSTLLEGVEEFFCGNSRKTSDCRVCGMLLNKAAPAALC